MNKTVVFSIILVTISLATGLLIAEGAYRAYLYRAEPYYFQDDSGLWYFQTSPVVYDADYGFRYVPGEHSGGAIYGGQVTDCWNPIVDYVFNSRGNSGRIRGSYEDAEFKVLVFGDSVTQRPRVNATGEYMTWPNFLQDYLEEKWNIPVHVVNFARDGYGVLQMFDLAAGVIDEWQPDLIIFAFITDDLTRDRIWRSTSMLDGRERIMISRSAEENPNWGNSAEAFVVEPRATSDWCQSLLDGGVKNDPLVLELEQSAIDSRRRNSLLADPYDLGKSYIYELLVYDSPYHSTFNRQGPTQMPRHSYSDFAEDQQLVRNMAKLDASGIPYLLIHLSLSDEFLDGFEYEESERYSALVKSFEQLARRQAEETMANIDMDQFDLRRIPTDPERDRHPSLYGHDFYAQMVLNVVTRACPNGDCAVAE